MKKSEENLINKGESSSSSYKGKEIISADSEPYSY